MFRNPLENSNCLLSNDLREKVACTWGDQKQIARTSSCRKCRVSAGEEAALGEDNSLGTLCCFTGHSVQDDGLEGSVWYPVSPTVLPDSSPNTTGTDSPLSRSEQLDVLPAQTLACQTQATSLRTEGALQALEKILFTNVCFPGLELARHSRVPAGMHQAKLRLVQKQNNINNKWQREEGKARDVYRETVASSGTRSCWW